MSDANKEIARGLYRRLNEGDFSMIGEGDKVVAMCRMTGVHKAEFMGIARSGQTINVGTAEQFRFEDGKVVEHWGVMDSGALMQQLSGATH
jgi:predicted ester cyclase